MKVIDLINERRRENKTPYYSFEYFPPKTQEATANLKSRIEGMVGDLDPLFVDITWGAGGSTSEATLDIASWIQTYSGTEVMMHLTLTNMPLEQVDKALESAKSKGIKNILALRGDPPRGQSSWVQSEDGFQYASDLVKYIKSKHGDYFGITVAGYPEGHIECESQTTDLQHLKEKIDAGGDIIVTQLFYDTDVFLEFVQRCREIGISCPIIPGIMPIQSYAGFHRMTSFCKTVVPQQIYDDLEAIKADEDAVKNYGIQLAIQMCQKLMDNGIEGFHFYTMNLERSVREILDGLGIVRVEKDTPWRKVANRTNEGTRPIHWAHRPKSYISRTLTWDDYPNGRWGDSRSPAFGFDRLTNINYLPQQKQKFLRLWGSPLSEEDIRNVFVGFINNQIDSLPWFEDKISAEIEPIKDMLLLLNSHGLLTLTSQPSINGCRSDDAIYGWGPHTDGLFGYLYMKCYLEFFCPANVIDKLLLKLKEYPNISYLAANMNGETESNLEEGNTIAVTWGVFPNREILQTTIVDWEVFFNWWKFEAFSVWLNEWGSLYEEGSPSRELLKKVHDTYWLVTIIDNDYIQGDLMGVFQAFFSEIQSRNSSSV